MPNFLRSCGVLILLVNGLAAEPPRLGIWNSKSAAAWWVEHPQAEDWQKGAAELHQALLGAQEKYGVERALKNEHFINWAMHRRWLSLLPPDFAQHAYFQDAQHLDRFAALGKKPALLELISGTLLPGDDGAKVAEALCRIAAARPDDFDEVQEAGGRDGGCRG